MRKDSSLLFIVAGRTGKSLVRSKIAPFAMLEQVSEIFVFCRSGGFPVDKCRYLTVPSWIMRLKPGILSKITRQLYEPFQLLFYTLKYRPDIINGIYCLPKGLNSFIVSRLTGTKCVNSIIGSRLEIETELPLRKLWEKINLYQLRRCDALTIKGEADRSYLISKGIKKENLFLFNGAVDTDRFSYNQGNRTTDILFVGSFIELKGVDRIINIILKLNSRMQKLSAVLAGDGVLLEKMKRLAGEKGLSGIIRFDGYNNNPVDHFRNSKILLMPSRSESLPTSMLEAMSCGCVPVISNVGNVTEAAIDMINSRVIADYSDIDAFSEAVFELLNNEELRKTLSKNGRLMAEEKYSIAKQSELAGKIVNYLL